MSPGHQQQPPQAPHCSADPGPVSLNSCHNIRAHCTTRSSERASSSHTPNAPDAKRTQTRAALPEAMASPTSAAAAGGAMCMRRTAPCTTHPCLADMQRIQAQHTLGAVTGIIFKGHSFSKFAAELSNSLPLMQKARPNISSPV